MRAVPIFAAALLALLGCGGGGSSPVPTGTVTVQLGSDSIPGYQAAVVSLAKLECSQDGGGWATLFDAANGGQGVTADLMALQNGHPQVISAAQAVPAGTYAYFRLTWGTRNYQSAITAPAYVTALGGSPQPMTMPSTTLLRGSATVAAGGATQVLLMLAGQQAVIADPGSATPYVFNAGGGFYDTSACGSVSGRLTASGTAVPGAEVYAETLDAYGHASLQRRALADASGNFELDGLPVTAVYYVASCPAGYAAQAGAPVNMATAQAAVVDLAFTAAATPGSFSLAITPPSGSNQGTWGELRQSLATGATGSQTLIVRSLNVTVGAQQDTALFPGLAPGVYGATAQRSTAGAAPVSVAGNQVPVSAGTETDVTLAY